MSTIEYLFSIRQFAALAKYFYSVYTEVTAYDTSCN